MFTVAPYPLLTESALVNQPGSGSSTVPAILAVIAVATLIFALRGFGRALEPIVQVVRMAVSLMVTTLVATTAITALIITTVIMIR